MLAGIPFDASKPIDPHSPDQIKRLMKLGAIAFPALVVVVAAIRSRGRMVERIPGGISILMILVLLVIPPLLAERRGVHDLWLQMPWLFLGAGFGEEIFFRGYVQSRVDAAFGCPVRIWGMQIGVGLLVSSLLFGFIHALNTVDYFHGRFDFGWSYGVEGCVQGLLFGCIRAKAGSVLPGAVTHGLLDAFARLPKVFFGG